MKSANDWEAITDRINEVMAGPSDADRVVALSNLASAVRDEVGQLRPEMLGLVRRCLPAIATYWNSVGHPIDPGVLRRFYELSESLDPPAQSPELSATWGFWRAAFANLTADFDSDWIQGATRWTEVCEVLATNEPRFLRGVGFPEEALEDVAHVEATLRQWIEGLEKLPEEEDDYEGDPVEPDASEDDERTTLTELPTLLAAFRRIFPGFMQDDEIEDAIDERRGEREERQSRYYQFESGPDDEGEGGPRSGSYEPSIADIFADL